MKSKLKFIIPFVLIMVITLGLSFLHFRKTNKEIFYTEFSLNDKQKEVIKKLNNIDNLSQEFMDNYFEEVSTLKTQDANKRLIVISENKSFDNYGAKRVIASPNNQYILEYASKKDKEDALEKLLLDDTIFSAEEDIIREVSDDGEAAEVSYMSWGIKSMGLDKAKAIVESNDTEPVIAAIIDTGFNYSYVGSWSDKIITTHNFLDNNTMYDDEGHGTHVAGTIMEGTPSNVKVMPLKVANTRSLSSSLILAAINWVVYNENADVINMSYGSGASSTAEYAAIQAAYDKNIICVCSAGNDNASSSTYPARYDNTFSIASVDSALNKSDFSNYGNVDFAAPGTAIKSLNGTKNGTSMAAPHATAAVSLLKSFDYDLNTDEAKEILKKHALDIGDSGYDRYFGHGFIYFNEDSLCDLEAGCLFRNEEVNYIEKIEPAQSLYKVLSNYGNDTNILNAKIKVTYTDGKTITYALWQLDDVDISGYDANKHLVYNVGIEFKGHSTELMIDNTAELNLLYTYSTLSDNTISLNTFTLSSTETIRKIIVPSEIDGKVVSTIGSNLYTSKAANVLYFEIPSSIVKIGPDAFADLGAMLGIKILSTHLSIGDNSFKNVLALKEIPGEIDSLGNNVFEGCSNLTSIHFSDQITSIPRYAFKMCSSLKTITLGENVTTISTGAFDNTTGLDTVIFNDKLKTIESGAFANSGIKTLHITKNVSSINNNAFRNANNLEEITTDPLNTTFDSRDDSNALINKSTNVLVLGSKNTVIPNSVTKIGTDAFYGRDITKLIIPSNVTSLDSTSFGNCKSLEKVAILNNSISIATNAFSSHISGFAFYVYKDSTGDAYNNTSNPIVKYYIDEVPFDYHVHLNKLIYNVGEEPDLTDSSVTLIFADPSIGSITYLESDNKYYGYCPNSFTFQIDDTFFYISTSYNDKNLKLTVPITVGYKDSTFELPTGLTSQVDKTLSTISLPENFEWVDPSQIIKHAGNQQFRARYNPGETSGYAVEKTLISVSVTKGIFVPAFNPILKMYDGTTNLDFSDITFGNLKEGEYSIVSATLASAELGSTTATIKVKLENKKFNDYTFSNGQSEMEFTTGVTISDNYIEPVTMVDKTYTYDGNLQTFLVNGFDEETMTISGNMKIDAGTYEVSITPKAGYLWTNGTNNPIVFEWVINKKMVVPELSISNKTYDGTSIIDIALVSVNNLEETDFEIVGASGDESVGIHDAKVVIKLLNANYKFSNDADIMEFTRSFRVVRIKLTKPTLVPKTYYYNGENQTASLNDFNATLMNITNNIKCETGTYEMVISLKDTTHYEWADGNISNVKLNFVIRKKIIYPNFETIEKEYSKDDTVDPNLIVINNLNKEDYTIVSTSSNLVIGLNNLFVKIRLTDEFFKNNTFDGGLQEKEFTTKLNVIKSNIKVSYSFVNDTLGYDGAEHLFNIVLSGYDKDLAKVYYMSHSGKYDVDTPPVYTEVGTYLVKFKILIDDDFYNPIYGEHEFKITSCPLNISINNFTGLYDGNNHFLNVDITGGDYEAYYALGDYNYKKDIPKISDLGNYTINYKIISSVCDPIIGTRSVNIYGLKEIKNVTIKNNIIILTDNGFNNLKSNVVLFGDGYTISHGDKNDNLLDRNEIYTGDKLLIRHPSYGNKDYKLSYLGDPSGDGKISALDYVTIKNHIMSKYVITDPVYLAAADATKDDKISALDYVKIKNYIMNGGGQL